MNGKICSMQTNQKRTRVAILISSKTDFKIKIGISKKEGQYVILKRVKHSRIYNNYKCKFPPKLSPKIYEAKIDRTEVRNSSTIIMGYFNTPLSILHRINRGKIIKEIEDLSNSINPLDLTDIQRILHPATAEYNLKLTWNVLQIVHMLVHKTNIKNF